MRHECTFYIDEDDSLVCQEVYDGRTRNKDELDTRMLLRKLDKLDFSDVRIYKGSILLRNDRYKVMIEDYRTFREHGGFDLLPNTSSKIEKAIKKHQREKHKKAKIKNLKKNCPRVAVGMLTLTLLGGGLTFAGKKIVQEDKSTTIDYEHDLDNDMETSYQELINETNLEEMLSELETNNTQEDNIFENNDDFTKEDINTTYLDYSESRDEKKQEYAYDNFNSLVTEYANKWGISPNIIMGMLTQESGGKEVNLMQIQFYSWEDQLITAYNFRDNTYQTIVLTKNPEKYANQNVMRITPDDLKNPKTNISVGCILLRKSAESMNYHVGASIQCYNFGISNMNKVLNQTSNVTGLSVDEILDDQSNLDFMDYTGIINVGDSEYLNHVMSFVQNPEDGFYIKYRDRDGNIIENNVAILPENTMSY